uniref:Uncharacterized protein n=1 Tax=viral metagenome TaxID=1070528 RepID=A0A6C0BF13_9ZZZZ
MFRVFNRSNVENIIYLQGAQNNDSNASVGSIIFQNYHSISNINIGAISATLTGSNGDYGDIVIKTRSYNDNNLSEKMRILHNGNVTIGNSNNKLNVKGDIYATGTLDTSNVNTNTLETSNILTQNYSTQRIYFTKNISSNFANSIHLSLRSNEVELDASCIVSGVINSSRLSNLDASVISSGHLVNDVMPDGLILNNIVTSNLTSIANTSTPRITFTRGSNVNLILSGTNANLTASNVDAYGSIKCKDISVGFPFMQSDPINDFRNMTNWNIQQADVSVIHARFGYLNKLVFISFSFVLSVSGTDIQITLPKFPLHSFAHPQLYTSINNTDIYGKVTIDSNIHALVFKTSMLSTGIWYASGSMVYECL